MNPRYMQGIEQLSETRKCSDTLLFEDYIVTRLKLLPAFKEEKFTMERRNRGWKASRRLRSHLSRVCDRMFHRTSIKRKRQPITPDPELRSRLRLELRRRRSERKADNGMASVVFFGNGRFQAGGYGHAPVPKKALLKLLCTRGPTVLLDEYNTSKICPCGKAELETKQVISNGGSRVRCHKAVGGGDHIPCSIAPLLDASGISFDRDILATLNMLQCAACGMRGLPRPTHLCRECH